MPRTWGLAHASGVTSIPTTTKVDIVASVEKMWVHKDEGGGDICLGIYPMFVGAPLVIGRKLTFSLEEFPELGFSYRHVGEIKLLGHDRVYLLLERGA